MDGLVYGVVDGLKYVRFTVWDCVAESLCVCVPVWLILCVALSLSACLAACLCGGETMAQFPLP